ncbi:MAG: hypothetical protein KC933_17630 [Myxococcales bacterium]|nr:hypothetical protein [Myxococcales bacterium]
MLDPAAALTQVTFHFAAAPGRAVTLVGDFPSWKQPHPMTEVRPGAYEVTLALAPGIYRYKLRTEDGAWHPDPAADATDPLDDHGNSLKVVGGAAPPVFLTSGRHHLRRARGGALDVHLEVDATAPVPARIWAETAEGRVQADLHEVLTHRGRRMLQGRLVLPDDGPGSLQLDRYPHVDLPLPAPRAALDEGPTWAVGATFYQVLIDRWRRGRASPPDPRLAPRDAPSHELTVYGGDLAGLTEDLPALAELGLDALVLSPVQPGLTCHRYDATDLLTVDPRLGGEAALERLVAEAHRHGLRVVLDLALTHVSHEHPAFRDLLTHQTASRYAGWFQVLRFPVRWLDARTYRGYADHPWLPRLDLTHPEVVAHAISAARRLADLGVDGLRLDAMDDVPDALWGRLRAELRAAHSELLFLGEVVHDDLARHLEARGADLATDFAHRGDALAFFARGALDAEAFWHRHLARRHRQGPLRLGTRLYFLDNLDTARFSSLAEDPRRLHLALAWLALQPEPIALTYGTELAMAGGADDEVLEHVWQDRLPMPDHPADGETYALLRSLLALRQAHLRRPALEAERLYAEGQALVLRVGALVLALNVGPTMVSLPHGLEGEVLLTVGDAPSVGPLPALSGRVSTAPGSA